MGQSQWRTTMQIGKPIWSCQTLCMSSFRRARSTSSWGTLWISLLINNTLWWMDLSGKNALVCTDMICMSMGNRWICKALDIILYNVFKRVKPHLLGRRCKSPLLCRRMRSLAVISCRNPTSAVHWPWLQLWDPHFLKKSGIIWLGVGTRLAWAFPFAKGKVAD